MTKEEQLRQAALIQAGIATQREHEAVSHRAIAVRASERLEISLAREKEAAQKATEAQEVALRERDIARNLRIQKEAEATAFGYFKSAFDDVAAGNRKQAILSLEKAFEYFKEKKNKQNQITTLVNIGDVYRGSLDGAARDQAVEKYREAIKLIGKDSEHNLLVAATKKKAGSAWDNSADEKKRKEAATFHHESATVYEELGKEDEAASEYIASGKTFIKSTDEESLAEGVFAFLFAIAVYDDSNVARYAATCAEIGKTIARVVYEEDETLHRTGPTSTFEQGQLRNANLRTPQETKRRDELNRNERNVL